MRRLYSLATLVVAIVVSLSSTAAPRASAQRKLLQPEPPVWPKSVEPSGVETDAVPDTLLPGGVSGFTLAASRLTYLTLPYCPPIGPNSPAPQREVEPNAASDPVLISRIPTYGGAARVLFSKNDPRAAGVCNPYRPSSNLAADSKYIYWAVGDRLVRLGVNANPGQEPQPWGEQLSTEAGKPIEVLVAGDLVVAMSQIGTGVATFTVINKNTGATSRSAQNGNNPRRLGWDGKYLYYLASNTLRRLLPGQNYTTLINPVTYATGGQTFVFPPLDYFVAEVAGGAPSVFWTRQNIYSDTDFTRVSQVYMYDTAAAQTYPFGVYSGVGEIDGLFADGTTVYVFEKRVFCSNPAPGCFGNKFYNLVLRQPQRYGPLTGYYGDPDDTRELYSREVPAALFSYDSNLRSDRKLLFWTEGEQLFRLAADAAGTPLVNMGVSGIEVTQGIQSLANGVRLIQNRRTFARVYVKADSGTVPNVTADLYGFWSGGPRGGSVVAPINQIGPRISVSSAPSRDNIDQSFLFELPWDWTTKSDLRLTARLNPYGYPFENNAADNTYTAGPFSFQPSPRLPVQFVAFGYTINNVTLRPNLVNDVLQTYSYIRRTFPLASGGGFIGDPSPGFRPNVWLIDDDNLGSRVDRSDKSCKDNLCASAYVNSRLTAMRTEEGIAGTTFMYGMISDIAGWFPRGQEGGSSVSSGPVGVPGNTLINEPAGSQTAPGSVWDTDRTYGDWYAAHEIGHSLGRNHPDSGSDDPATKADPAKPATVENCRHSRSDPGFPHGDTKSARAPIGASDGNTEGFDGGDAEFGIARAVLPSSLWNDFMSYCSNQWISDYTYNAIYDRLRAGSASVRAATVQRSQVAGDWLSVFGSIAADSGSASIDHLRRRASVAEVPQRTPGGFSIRLLGADSSVLADYAFTPADGDSGGRLGFGQVVPWVAGTREVRIVRLGDNAVLAAAAISATAPVVSNVRLENTPQPVADTATLAWDASDADGNALEVDVLYSRDGGTSFQPVELGVSGANVAIDTKRLGGGQAIFRVVVSDGANSAQADSPPFAMADKAPQPRISSPADGTRLRWGQLLNLAGEAEEFQDGALNGDKLVWSTPAGVLGKGALVTATSLPAGENVITLTATNSAGISASTKVTVFVDDELEPPGPMLAAAPGTINWHVGAGVSAQQTAQLSVANIGAGDLAWIASSDAAWLTLSATSGNAPAVITLSGDPSGIAPGTTAGATLTISTGSGPSAQSVKIRVGLSVGDARNSLPPGAQQTGRRTFLPLARK